MVLESGVIFAGAMNRVIGPTCPAKFVFAFPTCHVVASSIFLNMRVAFGTRFGMRGGPRGKAIVSVRIFTLPLLILVTRGVAVPLYHAICDVH